MTEKLIIEFKDRNKMELFARWLCGSGEQDYWTWMEAGCEHDKKMDELYPGRSQSLARTKEDHSLF